MSPVNVTQGLAYEPVWMKVEIPSNSSAFALE